MPTIPMALWKVLWEFKKAFKYILILHSVKELAFENQSRIMTKTVIETQNPPVDHIKHISWGDWRIFKKGSIIWPQQEKRRLEGWSCGMEVGGTSVLVKDLIE